MLLSTLIGVLSNIIKDKGDLKVFTANDDGEVNLVTGIPNVYIGKIVPDNLVVVDRKQLEQVVEDTVVIIG